MTLYTSGDLQVCDHSLHLVKEVYDWFYIKYPEFRKVDVEVHQCNLTESNCYGFCQIAEDSNDEGKQEFLVHVHHSLPEREYITTILHEFVHIVQTIRGLFDDERRESEALLLENVLYDEFKQGGTLKVSL
tara:strand:- start:34 stop:426 length:393 start_codon:yes stop_codon:yes gene_type:complete